MRLVTQAAQLQAAVQSARSESQSAFGSGELLLERALLEPRHVEVQVFADTHGQCIHLGERDCSVQRRHQKIIEETPSPAVRRGPARAHGPLRGGARRRRRVMWVPHGGVPASRAPSFFLMEMNTRLQVEHPITKP
jgi:3-methylcrotonyl-CoA carboxylase alpha subunit/geranyl-CoA carboxylase alpha subunit